MKLGNLWKRRTLKTSDFGNVGLWKESLKPKRRYVLQYRAEATLQFMLLLFIFRRCNTFMLLLWPVVKGYKGYKDGLQPETLADGNWLVKQNQPVSKVETKSDTNLRNFGPLSAQDACIGLCRKTPACIGS